LTTLLPSYQVLEEPLLAFHCMDSSYRTVNPIEGLISWGPYDSSIQGFLRPDPLRLAIVTPENSFVRLVRFLNQINSHVPSRSGDEYVPEWLGFNAVFRARLTVPSNKRDRLVRIVPEEVAQQARQTSEPEIFILDQLKNQIRDLVSISSEFDVIVVHIPSRWKEFREKRTEHYRYDLHDSLKVFGAPNNIKLQLIEEKSFHYADQARVMWWLGLALYAKSNGIPWKLAESTPNTAYVGLSYGISTKECRNRIIMGCSQVFDENGQGLKFLLYPVESPVFRGRNPFLSQEDARRLFTTLREIYQDANGRVPSRVVVHKTSHFTNDEMNGIATALAGVEEIELIQIQQHVRWKAIASNHGSVSKFPVSRGTIVPLDAFSFLVWTQGDVLGIADAGRHYYQEKRGVPSPLLVRRFRGVAPLEQVAREILKLTKMDWNNNQLYTKLPVSIKFSSILARIAEQVDHSWQVPNPYDFRFFI